MDVLKDQLPSALAILIGSTNENLRRDELMNVELNYLCLISKQLGSFTEDTENYYQKVS